MKSPSRQSKDKSKAEPSPAAPTAAARLFQIRLLVVVLTLLGLWIGRSFLLPLAWAATIAIALWPLYCRVAKRRSRQKPLLLAPLGFTIATALILMLPLAIVALEAARDSQAAVDWVAMAQKQGVATPDWLAGIPYVGPRMALWWRTNLADPHGAGQLLGQIDASAAARWMGAIAAEIATRSLFFAITILSLFILLRDGEQISRALNRVARRLYGGFGERFTARLGEAVRGAVNGTVLVAIGEGSLIGIGYAVAGVPRPVLFTLVTIAVAMLPFGAWLAFGIASAVLAATGHPVAGLVLLGFGAAVMLIGDNIVQPALIGNSVRLPFLWAMVAIFGGLQSFGLVGLFIGPALMAALFLVWKEWLGADAGPLLADNRKR